MGKLIKILKFSSEKCAPCKALDIFLKDNTPEHIEIISVTRETHPGWFGKYGVRMIPLLMQIDENDKEVKRWRGSTFMFLLETARRANKKFE